MKQNCIRCQLKEDIDRMNIERDHLIFERKANVMDSEIANLSQAIERFNSECESCKSRRNNVTQTNGKNIFGCHISFYYYGVDHLIVNMCSYISRGIKNNELVIISAEQEVYDKLILLLKNSNIPSESVVFYPVEDMVLLNKQEGVIAVRNSADKFLADAKARGYSGIRWIGQPSYAMRKTSKEDFLAFELSLTEMVREKEISILCIYDAYDYMTGRKYVDCDVMNESMHTHTHMLDLLNEE